jgi:uncharacterized membrane protein YeiH
MLYLFDLLGVVVFAISGSIAAGRKEMDLFGVVVLAMVTALGGGTLRDLILGAHPVFWISNHAYLLIAFAAALFTFIGVRFHKPPEKLLLIADAFGLATFTVVGVEKTLHLGFSSTAAVIMGMMTGVAGSMLRDLLSGEAPLILRREIYATASLLGAVTLVIFPHFSKDTDFNLTVAFAVILVLRLAAIRWKLSLPILFVRS